MNGSKRLHGTTVFENHKKVSFNIASEPSNVEILSGQKLIKVPKMVQCASFWKPKASGQTMLQGHF